jgi:serine/threonine-protein kinase ATR
MLSLLLVAFLQAAPPEKPALKDFLGINGHFTFRPRLYAPACSLVRNYHSMEWDVGKDTDFATTYPFARNRVNWETTYGSWKAEGFTIDASLMFANLERKAWKSPAEDAYRYGKAFAAAFGPSSRNLVTSAEVGNEPGHYDDPFYRTIFEAMAKGLREGDPKLAVLTCNLVVGKSHRYAKSVDCVKGLEPLYDVLNIHTYAEVEGWPTWRRSFPEDPAIAYLKDVEKLIAWRNQNAPGKRIWITEYGWDATTKPQAKTGDFAKWVGVSDEQQARYLVRSTLVFMAMDVQRAYIYFYDDKDEASVHAASGLTRNFQPKPSYHAVSHLRKTLGEHRLSRILLAKPGEVYAYEFVDPAGKRIVAAWSPTGTGRQATVDLDLVAARIARAERMPLGPGGTAPLTVPFAAGRATLPLTEAPLYLWLE